MRLSLDPKSPDFDPALGATARVYLNGQLRNGVLFADASLGLAKVLRLDESGKARIDPRSRQPIVDSFFGNVRIEWADKSPLRYIDELRKSLAES